MKLPSEQFFEDFSSASVRLVYRTIVEFETITNKALVSYLGCGTSTAAKATAHLHQLGYIEVHRYMRSGKLGGREETVWRVAR